MLTHEIMQELDTFVAANQLSVTDALENHLHDINPDALDTLEVLQQSLYAAGILSNLYRKYPRFMLMLINRMLKSK